MATYLESYRNLNTVDEIKKKAGKDALNVMIFFGGNVDRLRNIEDAANQAITEKEYRKAMPEKCKNCYWFSNVTVNCCEIDGSDPCDPEEEACSRFESKDDN